MKGRKVTWSSKISTSINKWYETHENPRKGKSHTQESKEKMHKPHNCKNFTRSADVCAKISLSLKGRLPWNKGLTKETDERIAKYSKVMKGHDSWSKGLTKNTDERVKKISQKLLGKKSWSKGLTKETNESLVKISKKLIGHIAKPSHAKLQFISELGHGVRSSWEKEFSLMLKSAGIQYAYEDTIFDVQIDNGMHKYHPDFRIKDDYFIEVKGYIQLPIISKLNAFVEQYPNTKFVILGLDNSYQKNKLKCRIVPWADREKLVEEIMCL